MKISSSTVITIFLGLLVCCAVVVVGIVGLRFFSRVPENRAPEPEEITLSSTVRTNPALICYREVKRIRVSMEKLYGIACGADERIYVTGDEQLLIIEKEGEKASWIQLDEPAMSIASGKDGSLYLGMAEHVEQYESGGMRKAIWASLGNEAIITSIAVGVSDVYVADAGNKLVMRYDRSGKLLKLIEGEPDFLIPSPYFDVAIGRDHTIWVANTGRFSLQNYSLDGKLLKSWGSSSERIDGFCGCCNPTHIALLSDGSFVTSEKGTPRVKRYDPAGGFDCVVAGAELFRPGTVGLDLAVDEQDRILVLDPVRRVVRIFERK
jgi:hypothetical protein